MNTHTVSGHIDCSGNGRNHSRNGKPVFSGRVFQRSDNAPCGFTLLEILVTLAIFAIVATTIFGSFSMVFTSAESIHKGIDDYEMAKNCLDRMRIDLRSVHVQLPPAYTQPDIDDPPDPYRIVGDKTYPGTESFPRLRFASLAHVSFEEKVKGGIARIVYYIQETAEGGYVLRRSDSLYPYKPVEEDATDPILCERIKSFKLTYYDDGDESFEIWNSDDREFGYATPRSIGIALEIGEEPNPLLFKTTIALPVWREKKE